MPLAADLWPGPEGAAEECAAGWGVCCLRLAPPTAGLAQKQRRRGAQLDGDFSFHAYRRRLRPGPEAAAEGGAAFALHALRRRLRAWPGGDGGGALSWTGSYLSMPLAADLGPGPEGAAEGRPSRRGVCVTTWPASLGWPSGPAGVTLEGRLACFAGFAPRARGPARATRTDYLIYCSQRA